MIAGWIVVALYLAWHLARLALRALASMRNTREWNREREARREKQLGAAERLAETAWLLSRSRNAAQRARHERDRDRLTQRLLAAFGMGDE